MRTHKNPHDNIRYYHCYKHYPGEDLHGKYLYEIYLNDELVKNVFDADSFEGWVRIKIFEKDFIKPSSKKKGIVKINKNYVW